MVLKISEIVLNKNLRKTMKKIFSIIVISLFCLTAFAQNGFVKGFVYDASNGDALMFANVIVENTRLGSSTDINGYFVINKVPKGKQTIKISSLGFADTTIQIDVIPKQPINLKI